MQEQIKVQGRGYYCEQTHSPSIKLSISYPTNIPNITYNFQLTLTVSIQKLLPKITYTQVLEQKIYTPRKQIILNQLKEKTMYKLKLKFNKHISSNIESKSENNVLNVEKTLFVFTQGRQQAQQLQYQEQQNGSQSYSSLVRQNIKDYFNQYHSQQQPINNNNIQSSQQYHHHQRPSNNNYQSSSLSSSSSLIRSKQQPTITSSSINTTNYNNTKTTKLSNSESLIKVIGENDPLINKKKLQKYILQARTSSSTKDYLTTKDYQCFNQMNKVYKNQKQRRQHIEKTLLVTKAINMFSEIYNNDLYSGVIQFKTNQKTGNQFFKNDWFMGPFYSYNVNQKQMKKKNINTYSNSNQLQE